MEYSLDGLELAERVAGDVAHCSSVLETIWNVVSKPLSKNRMMQISAEGFIELHRSSNILYDEKLKDALERMRKYKRLKAIYLQVVSNGVQLRQSINSTKVYHPVKKVVLYRKLLKWRDRTHETTILVMTQSDLAKLELELVELDLNGSSSTSPIPAALSSSRTTLTSPSEHTLVPPVDRGRGSLDEYIDISDDSHRPIDFDQYSETDSIFGNPWSSHTSDRHDHTSPATVLICVSDGQDQ